MSHEFVIRAGVTTALMGREPNTAAYPIARGRDTIAHRPKRDDVTVLPLSTVSWR